LSTAWEQGMTEWSNNRWLTMKFQQALIPDGVEPD
jgi:hypothetical protein